MSRKMYVEPEGGLGNRFNCIISAIAVSKKYGYKLHIMWNRTSGCAIKFCQLLEPISGVKIFESYRRGYRSVTGILTFLSTLYCGLKKRSCHAFLDEQYMKSKYQELTESEKQQLFEAKKIYISTSCRWVDEDDFERVREEIVPKKEYFDMVDDVLKNVNREKLYGLHIRRTDHVVSIQNCPTILFTNKIDQLINEDPDVVFYVATDDYDLEQELKEKYGNHIVQRKCFSKQVTRATKAGMMDAFVDVLCLSKCKKIFGSDSTFSTLAAYLGNTELEMMTMGK